MKGRNFSVIGPWSSGLCPPSEGASGRNEAKSVENDDVDLESRYGSRLGLPGQGMPIQSGRVLGGDPESGRREIWGQRGMIARRGRRPMPKARLRRRVILAALVAVLIAPPAGYVAWDRWTDNLGTLEPGRIYRSGQMPATTLAATVRERKIKTVLNLRGPNPAAAWYRDERAATTAAGATQVDLSMSSCEWMSRIQLRTLVQVLDGCAYPLLVHCQWGSERTGWVSAVASLLRPGSTLDDAKKQFSVVYLFVRAGDGKVMAEHLDQYETWLNRRGVSHSPEQFRLWVADGYLPGLPGREQWPYDPYPLVVVTRPAAASAPVAGARLGMAGVLR